MKRVIASAIALLSVTLAGTDAFAQQLTPEGGRTWFQDRVAAPSSALELTVASGYTQGFGMLRQDVGMPQVATPGIGFDLGAAYRINPRWGVGLVGQYHELYAPNADSARGMTAGLAATYHFDPETRLDPWLELGTGYRLLWEDQSNPKPTVFTHGFQLARARVGFDIRVSPEVAIAPVVGADVNVFLFQDGEHASREPGTSAAIADPRPNTFVFAGLQGRFDLGGTRTGDERWTARAPEPVYYPVYVPASETTVTSAVVEKDKEEAKPVSPSIAVSDEIARACSLQFADITKAPKFEFNKSDLLPADHEVLIKIGECVATGPLQGRSIRLVGHADPRGTYEYNMALGARRANGVATFLSHFGIDRTRMQQTSRGELDATGKNEAGWQLDRRVDIYLAE